jgi:hypothetical protein
LVTVSDVIIINRNTELQKICTAKLHDWSIYLFLIIRIQQSSFLPYLNCQVNNDVSIILELVNNGGLVNPLENEEQVRGLAVVMADKDPCSRYPDLNSPFSELFILTCPF